MKIFEDEVRLVSDKTLAKQLAMSPSWVRVQRHYRRNNQDHILNIDPVMVGSSPRYLVSDVERFIESLQLSSNSHYHGRA